MKKVLKTGAVICYFAFLMVPIYWMFKTSLKTTMEAEGWLQWYPANPTIDNYAFIIRSPEWLRAFRHTIQYAALNVAIVVTSTLPAAYAFSRVDFRGRKHLPLMKRGISVAAFFVFMFSWVKLILARTLTSTNTKPFTVITSRKMYCMAWSPGP